MNACVEKPNCTALNYNAATTHCTLRGCKFPITAPNNNRWDHFGYWRFSLSSSGRCRWTKTKTRNILGRALLDIFSAHMQQCCSWGEQVLQRCRRLWEEAHWGHCYCRRVPWTLPGTTTVHLLGWFTRRQISKLYFITPNRFGTMRTLGVGRGNAGLLRNQKMASRNLTMAIVSVDLVKVIVEQLNAWTLNENQNEITEEGLIIFLWKWIK